MTKAATNLCGCSSSTQCYGLSIFHYFSASKSNTTLFSSVEYRHFAITQELLQDFLRRSLFSIEGTIIC